MPKWLNTLINCLYMGNLRYFRLLYREFGESKVRRQWKSEQSHIEFFRHELPIISIGSLKGPKKTAALLHELGHYVDFKGRNYYQIEYSYRSNPIHFEKSAWKCALMLSDKYKLPMDYEAAKQWLGTYGTTYQCLENRIN